MDWQRYFQDKHYLFWTLQFIGWSGWGLSFYLSIMVWGEPPDGYHFYLAVVCTIGMLLTLILRRIYLYIWDFTVIKRVIAVAIAAYAAASAWMLIRHWIFTSFVDSTPDMPDPEKSSWMYYLDGATSAYWVMLVWSALYFGIKFYLLLQEERANSLKTQAMAQEAQLKMLRYQLNPHFLFNTLNAISTLILDKDTEMASTMLARLSDFLRHTLDNDPIKKVTLDDELKALRLYLDIEKVRFDQRLQLHFDIAEEAHKALVPSLLLQPLVENAIKYAVAPSMQGGTIGVSATVFGGELLLAVADDGQGLDMTQGKTPTGGGVGLANCRERLRTLYGNQQSFRLSPTEPHGLTINIRLPLELGSDRT